MFQTLQIRNNQSIIIKLILIIIIIVIKTIIKSGKGIYIHTYRILSLCMRILIYKSSKKIFKKNTPVTSPNDIWPWFKECLKYLLFDRYFLHILQYHILILNIDITSHRNRGGIYFILPLQTNQLYTCLFQAYIYTNWTTLALWHKTSILKKSISLEPQHIETSLVAF